jgi:hypothetical protein
MQFGNKLLDEETLKSRHVKDNKTRFYWINLPEVGEKGVGLFLRLKDRAINLFFLWKHK